MEPALTPAPTWPGTSRRPKATRPERHTGNTGACRERCETRDRSRRCRRQRGALATRRRPSWSPWTGSTRLKTRAARPSGSKIESDVAPRLRSASRVVDRLTTRARCLRFQRHARDDGAHSRSTPTVCTAQHSLASVDTARPQHHARGRRPRCFSADSRSTWSTRGHTSLRHHAGTRPHAGGAGAPGRDDESGPSPHCSVV